MPDNWSVFQSPAGALIVVANDRALTAIHFEQEWRKPAGKPRVNSIIRQAKQQLSEYFRGKRRVFELPLALEGTEFQCQVWNALRSIRYGETLSYGEIARKIRRPQASRAVGAACGQNPLPIVIPCHRVIGTTGTLTGYGGGLHLKEWLLQHEGVEIA